MPYVTNRAIHDADAHILETPAMLADLADPDICERIGSQKFAHLMGGDGAVARFAELRRTHSDPDYRAHDEVDIMSRKNWHATGSFLKADRSKANRFRGKHPRPQSMARPNWNQFRILGITKSYR